VIFCCPTSKVTYHHLLSAPKPAPQATCRKCRRHGGWVNRPVRILFRSFYGRRRFANSQFCCGKCRSSVPDVALSVIHNTFWCSRIPLIVHCSLGFISNSLRCSRIGHPEFLHAGSGNPTLLHSATSLTPTLSADFSGIFILLRTSPVRYPHLLLASEPALQAKCQKCRRHGD